MISEKILAVSQPGGPTGTVGSYHHLAALKELASRLSVPDCYLPIVRVAFRVLVFEL